MANSWNRALRSLTRDGWRGHTQRAKYTARYWYFRFLVRGHHAHLAKAAPVGVYPQPLFSILLVAYRTESAWFKKAVDSVQAQTFGNWELCVALSEVSASVAEEARHRAAGDPRIRIFELGQNEGIAANNNAAARHARGEFLAVLDHDDYLEPHALAEVASVALSDKFDLIYTDEDVVSSRMGIPSAPNLKPDWSPESLLSYNYICHFCCFRRALFEELSGFQSAYDGAQDYDLFLRISERTARIAHIPKVLYHWRRHGNSSAAGAAAKPGAWDAGRRAVEAHLRRTGQSGTVDAVGAYGALRIKPSFESRPSVDILIPSANRDGTLMRCLESLTRVTQYSNFRAIVMLNGGGDFGAVRAAFAGREDVLFRDYTEPFNFSRINNRAVEAGRGEVLVFLNDDVEITQPDWLEGMLGYVVRKGVGAVGPMLLYPDGTVQHSGLFLDPEIIATEFHHRYPQTAGGYNLRLQTVQNVSAVTGACLCTPRSVFLEVGGFDEAFPLSYNDVDYCLKLAKAGYRTVYNPFVRLIHHESVTRSLDVTPAQLDRLRTEQVAMRRVWGREGLRDRHFNSAVLLAGRAGLGRLAAEYFAAAEAKAPKHED